MFSAILVVLAAYLIGSVPFPIVVSRLVKGIDLREHGSGNMGAMNAARVLGRKWFPVVFLLDVAKGALATYLGRLLMPMALPIDPVLAAAVGGAAAVIGHCFPVYVGFKGGVGLAASFGALLLISPVLMVSAALVLVLVWGLARNLYVGTAAAALAYPLLSLYWLHSGQIVMVMTIWGVMIAALHLKDIKAWLAEKKR